ncbi:MAG: DUF2924 domain-containing protein [Ahniella sp.]|nr:DUF2924 domain-containing protein [Ahniella sp.]
MSTKKTATKKTTSKKAPTSKSKNVSAKRKKPAAKRPAPAEATARPRDPNAPAIGTTLKRSFKGQDIMVKVTADGFVFGELAFSSLSAVARHITGYMVSGPVFFKLVEPKRAAKAAK